MKKTYTYDYGQAQDVGARDNQEDAILYSDASVLEKKGILVVLSDGMGGLSDGEKFSEIATRCMVEHFEKTERVEDMCEELRACFNAAQKEALEANKTGPEGGATVVAVLLRDGRCAYLSAGDSTICLLRNGALMHLNREQELGVTLDESVAFGYLDEEFAKSNIRRGSLTFHLGSENEQSCDVCCEPFRLVLGDRIALMSDGVAGTLSDSEIERILANGNCQQAAKEIISTVLKQGKERQDNCSVAVVGYTKKSLLG